MTMSNRHEQILNEIRELPPEHLEHLLELIREYKAEVQQAGQQVSPSPSPADLAGVWADMSEEETNQILQLYKQRQTYWTMREIDV